ncbi:type II secretion system protein [Patescibacteria group bacterium]
MKLKKGFTLIELLIVIAIIGILSAALLPTILNAPAKARDSARILNISSLATAIESYNADQGGYPATAGCLDGSNAFKDVAADYFSGGISGIPLDPSGARTALAGTDAVSVCAKAGNYYYTPVASTYGQYAISAAMELAQNNNSGAAPAATGDPITACAASGCIVFIQVQ